MSINHLEKDWDQMALSYNEFVSSEHSYSRLIEHPAVLRLLPSLLLSIIHPIYTAQYPLQHAMVAFLTIMNGRSVTWMPACAVMYNPGLSFQAKPSLQSPAIITPSAIIFER